MTNLAKYCNKCGKELISNQTISEYDIFSGKPVEMTVTLHCPDYRSLFKRTNGHYKAIEEVNDSLGIVA